MNTTPGLKEERVPVLTRLLDAPCHLVFEAWTKPELLARWWGPNHFTLPICEQDFRAGGLEPVYMHAISAS